MKTVELTDAEARWAMIAIEVLQQEGVISATSLAGQALQSAWEKLDESRV